MVEKKFNLEKQKVKAEVEKATAVAFTSDMWTSIHMDAYLALTCHYVNQDDQLASVLLTVGKFGQHHTAANIAAVKASIMEEWGISKSKVMCLTTDGAANMGLCSNMLQLRHSHCIAHNLNLVVRKAIQATTGLESVRGKARDVAPFLEPVQLAGSVFRPCNYK